MLQSTLDRLSRMMRRFFNSGGRSDRSPVYLAYYPLSGRNRIRR